MKNRVYFDGREYDISVLKKIHPGGQLLLEAAEGNDISEVYRSYHGRDTFPMHLPSISNDSRSEEQATEGPYKTSKPYKFSAEYRALQQAAHIIMEKHPQEESHLDAVMWFALGVYVWDVHPLISAVAMIVLGAFGHQYVHTSSHKASMLTFAGFISHKWREEHVFVHHPYTNTTEDDDLDDFLGINKMLPRPIPSWMRLAIVSNVIVFRPFIQAFIPKYHKKATFWDVAVLAFLFGEIAYKGISFHWWLKRLIPSAWFLIIDYFNHYRSADVSLERTSNDWMEQQLATTQNFVIHPWLFKHYPTVHCFLTFGLDRQVEHHLFPRLRLQHLPYAHSLVPKNKLRTHVLSWETVRILCREFV